MQKLKDELNEKILEIKRLQSELTRRDTEEGADAPVESLKLAIATLEKENARLKAERSETVTSLNKNIRNTTDIGDSDNSTKHSANFNEVHSSKSFQKEGAMSTLIKKLEQDLKVVLRERDKEVQELTRLKQHLLDKEHEESDKMDEDSKLIEELRENCEYQRSQILHLEKALNQAIAGQEEVKKINSDDVQKSIKKINNLEKKLANSMSAIDAKNMELLNLQTALGQYYAETEAKGRSERDLAHAREECTRLSERLKDANGMVEMLKEEREGLLVKFSQAEQMVSEGKRTVLKLEADNSRLRQALEQSISRLNRMSTDSDYFVDRRIVIKLLVTYFQRGHSKEVLDLMVRMLGFSEEDKQRIGVAQQGVGKGVVRGVLGLPGRFVGGILGGSSEASSHLHSENHSFADLWVDFLLKETEERGKSESAGAHMKLEGDQHLQSPSTASAAASVSNSRKANMPSLFSVASSNIQTNLVQPEHLDREFSTIPLTPSVAPLSETTARTSRH
ncbi:hypothetical protein Syun_019124 [Stephania yunnanensis]|uniref:GRIP domain-containing protein n=1 Tax=Stephania yunnanensis TaxID=152371 RepID=A0AAP0NVM3_9MAGN